MSRVKTGAGRTCSSTSENADDVECSRAISGVGGEALQYLQRQNSRNSRIKDYRIAVSADGTTWTDVATGSFTEVLVPQNVEFTATLGRYVRLTGLSSHPGNAFAGAAELNVGGTQA